jgi:hypothetical protein
MPFTVLFGEEDTVKSRVLESVTGAAEEDAEQSHEMMRRNYRRAHEFLQQKKVHDFLAEQRLLRDPGHPLHKYNRFRILGTLRDSRPRYEFVDGSYVAVREVEGLKTCPFCSECVPEDTLGEHMRAELESRQRNITVIFDKSIRTEHERLVLECSTVKELKRIVFDRTGVSVSKQDVFRGEVLLGNNESLGHETVVLRQKKRRR